MRPVLTAAQLRAAEQSAFDATPGLDLMGRAAKAVARIAADVAPNGQLLVVAGSGNNGGDGLFAAALLARHRPVLVWTVNGSAHEDGAAAAGAAGCQFVNPIEALQALPDCALVIDAVAGLGSRRGLPAALVTFAEACEAAAVPVLAVDLPSGVGADSAAAPEASFRAAHTVTFAALKPCHVLEPAAGRCGEVHVVDIGVETAPGQLSQAEESDIARWWPTPVSTSDKYSRGVVLFDTGSQRYQGAALLGLSGALHAGAGMVRYGGPVAGGLILSRFPSVVLGEGRAQAVVLGSGWGEDEKSPSRVESARLHADVAVVDADALYCLPGRADGWLLTPHAGELARLLGCTRRHVEENPVSCAREVARATGATVLLKGATQYVAEPSGRVTVAVAGPAWSAQAGSGDVLAGICGALLAAGLPAWQAGVVGASLQAMTAGRNPGPYPPDALASRLPAVIAELIG